MTTKNLETEWRQKIGHVVQYNAKPIVKTGLVIGTFSNNAGVGVEVLTRTPTGRVTRRFIDSKRIVEILPNVVPSTVDGLRLTAKPLTTTPGQLDFVYERFVRRSMQNLFEWSLILLTLGAGAAIIAYVW